jgi:hypothetical protein
LYFSFSPLRSILRVDFQRKLLRSQLSCLRACDFLLFFLFPNRF